MIASDQSNGEKKQRLGEILVKRGVITEKQLEEALTAQKEGSKPIGEVLVDLGFAKDREIVVALVVQCNIPYIAIDKYEIDNAVVGAIPGEIARQHSVIPLDRVGDVLSVVMANPLDSAVKEELQKITQCSISTFIATKNEINQALNKWYS